MSYDNIPSELKLLRQWVCWAGDKRPRNALTGQNAQSNNPNTWATFEQALDGLEMYHFDGIGFMFANGYFGVDIDHAIDDTDLMEEFTATLGSYTEVSRSGTGIHIICKGQLPAGARRKGNIEMYQSGRYFITTGNVYGDTVYPITDCTETVKILHAKYLGGEPVVAKKSIVDVELDDLDVIEKASSCASGGVFQLLYRGEWAGMYASQSEAELAFCNHLAFWTQRKPDQMDRIFRSSRLFRDKWDRRQSGSTYGMLTIQKAIVGTKDVYDPMHRCESVVVGAGKAGVTVPRKDYSYDDTGNANRFVDMVGENIRYSHQKKRWMYWDGKVWNDDLTGEIKKLSDLCLDEMKKEAFAIEDEDERSDYLKWISRSSFSKGKQNMLTESQHLGKIPVLTSSFDQNKDLLNCQSGIINLRNGELIEHDPNYMMSKISYSEYNPNETRLPEKWLKFLGEVTAGDKELQHYLQKAVGYSLTGSIREQGMFFCYGTGNNGKSTFLDVVSAICGTYSCNTQPESIMLSKSPSSGANQDIARLNGARFVTTVEPNDGVKLNEGLIKQLTGGDKVTARFLYGLDFEFVPEFKLWLGANHKPVIRGTDFGIWRRIHLIPFTVQVPPERVDKNLKHKLMAELPLIMKWAVDGAVMWAKEGLKIPDTVKFATEEYRAEMDVLAQFCELCVKLDYTEKTRACDLYEVYSHWADENHEYKMSNNRFGKEFSKKFPEKVRSADGWTYKNVMLTDYARRLSKQAKFGDFYDSRRA